MDIIRRQLLQAALPSTLAGRSLFGKPAPRPNVLVIICDEWRAQATGYNGDQNVKAPALDRFESESVNFQNAISG